MIDSRRLVLALSLATTACMEGDPDSIEGTSLEVVDNGRIVVVAFEDGAGDALAKEIAEEYGAEPRFRYRHAFDGMAFAVGPDVETTTLASHPGVRYAVEDRAIWASGRTARPVVSEWAPAGVRRVGGELTANEGEGVVVAILDTGIAAHPDLAPNLLSSYAHDCVDPGAATPGSDANGHGTHVAGIIAAARDGSGITGIGSSIQVVSVRILDDAGMGTVATALCGLDFVVANGGKLRVGLLAWSSSIPEGTDPLEEALDRGAERGITWVAAAGNDGGFAKRAPAVYESVIAVSAYFSDDVGDHGFPPFTNFGVEIDLAAPGVNVFSTWIDGKYGIASGTSQAAAHVAGGAALVLARWPHLSPYEVRYVLQLLGERGYPGVSIDHPEPLLDVRKL